MEKEFLLQLKNIHAGYEEIKVLHDISLHIHTGELIAIMGPNGAGKSTVLKAIFGLTSHTGHIGFEGIKINPLPHELVKIGIAYVPQGRRVFSSLTVQENLEMGAFFLNDKKETRRRVEEMYRIFPVLKNKARESAGSLSGGQQQLLAIARGLMTEPKLLLLDEPTLGLAPRVVKEVFEKIKEINMHKGTAIILVEHNLKSVLDIVDRAYVLNHGKIIKEETPANIIASGILGKVFTGEI